MKKEQIIIVDKNDNIIWHKEREKITIWKDIYRCSTLRVKNNKWEILITKRSSNKKINPWKRSSAVAWTNEKWETYESNIIKETLEEIWINLNKFEKVWKLMIENNSAFCTIFKTIINYDISKFKLQNEEVEEIKWINIIDLETKLRTNPEEFTPWFETLIRTLKLL